MKLISIAITAMSTVLMSSVGQARTINSDAEAASALLMLVAASEHPVAQGVVARDGDLSRSPEQIRRATLTMRRNQAAVSFRIAVQKPPL